MLGYLKHLRIIGTLPFLIAGLTGCGEQRNVTQFGRVFGSTPLLSSSNSVGWNSSQIVDDSAGEIVNAINSGSGVGAICQTANLSYATSGCVQQAGIVATAERFFLGFPQETTTFIYNPLGAMTSLTSWLFSRTDTTDLDGASASSAGYVAYAKLSNSKIIGVFWRFNVSDEFSVMANVFDPITGTWGTAKQINASGAGVPTFTGPAGGAGLAPKDLAMYYSGAGVTALQCRPRIATSGTTAMALWCENSLNFDLRSNPAATNYQTLSTYLVYSMYRDGQGGGWSPYTLDGSTVSSPVFSEADTTYYGTNKTTAAGFHGLHAEIVGGPAVVTPHYYKPGLMRRMVVPAFEPNALFIGEGTSVHVAYPIPHSLNPGTGISYALNASSFTFGLTPPATNFGVLLNDDATAADFSDLRGISSDGTRFFALDDGAVKIWRTLPNSSRAYANMVTVNNATASGVHSDGVKLYIVTANPAYLYILPIPRADCIIDATVPANTTCGSVVVVTAPQNLTAVHSAGSNIVVTSLTHAFLLGRSPGSNCTICGTCSSCTSLAQVVDAPTDAFTDGKRLFIADTDQIKVWNRIPTTDDTKPGFVIPLTGVTKVTSDGARLFANYDDGALGYGVKIWRNLPFDSAQLPNADITSTTPVTSLTWSKYLPFISEQFEWPTLDTTYAGEYSVNPKTKDQLSLLFRGQAFIFNRLPGDPFGFDRCAAISNVVESINQNQSFRSTGLKMTLPQEWGEPACGSLPRGHGQYFYLTHNPEASPDDGVDYARKKTTNILDDVDFDDIRLRATAIDGSPGSAKYGRFFIASDLDYDYSISKRPGTNAVNTSTINLYEQAQYFSGILHGDTSVPSFNGLPVMPPSGYPSNPALLNPFWSAQMDVAATGFSDLVGTGSGDFLVLQTARTIASPVAAAMCGETALTSLACALSFASTVARPFPEADPHLVPSEFAYPRQLFAYLFQNGDWVRFASPTVTGLTFTAASPKPFFLGPTQTRVASAQGNPQAIPLGVRNPRAVSNNAGKALILFYARDAARPYQSQDASVFVAATTPLATKAPNRLWMSTFDKAQGFTTPAVVGTNVIATTGNQFHDREVCETADPLTGATGPVTTFDANLASGCIVGVDPYGPGILGPTDSLNYAFDVPPIPAAMNSSGQAAVGYHAYDASGYVRYYVAAYGPERGLDAFTSIDQGSGYTMGGALAVDDSGNIAAVWEGRTLISRTSRSGYSSGTAAENHIYFRYYTAASAAWGTTVQVDSLTTSGMDITVKNPQAGMMPNVSFGAGGRIMITWSGPACDSLSSAACRRSQWTRMYRP